MTYVVRVVVVGDFTVRIEVSATVRHGGEVLVVGLGDAASCASKGGCRASHVVEQNVRVDPAEGAWLWSRSESLNQGE